MIFYYNNNVMQETRRKKEKSLVQEWTKFYWNVHFYYKTK